MTDKYSEYSHFVYTANNPILYIDPDGKKIVFPENASPDFKKAFTRSWGFINRNCADDIFAKLEKSKQIYTISETKGGSHYNPKTRTISWDPNSGSTIREGVDLSPTVILNHEGDHDLQHDQNPEQFKIDADTPDQQYGNKEEKRVIEGSEQQTALKLGEIKEGEVTRKDHGGYLRPT